MIPFAQPSSRTRVYAVASGKGGVGKSSVTVNLAAALAAQGLSVGVVDADIYGHSVPRMLGTSARPTQVEDMIMPPQAHGVKVISIGMFTSGNAAVVWRGPMLHRALQQFLADVYWGDLDVLLLDLPPGHRRRGDLAGPAAAQRRDHRGHHPADGRGRGGRAGRRDRRCRPTSGSSAWWRTCRGWSCPTASGWRSSAPAAARPWPSTLSRMVGAEVPLLGQIPLDTRVRESGDVGTPIVLTEPDAPAAAALAAIADRLAVRRESLAGKSLGLAPARRQ